MKKSTLYIFILFFICSNSILKGQDTINLINPSFEDKPRKGGSYVIKGWINCGAKKFPSESPPDIHSIKNNAWGVRIQPFDQKSYLGLVVRYNETYESVSQKLASPIIGGRCYSFSIYLARSETFLSATNRSPYPEENFTQTAILIIWGGDNACGRQEILAKSLPVDNSVWKENLFSFHPKRSHQYITIEAYYKLPISEAYNGHVLVDNLSPIIEIPCD